MPQIERYAYTQHVATVKALEMRCGFEIEVLRQDRSKDPVEDIAMQLATVLASGQQVVLYAVLPPDKAVELKQRYPQVHLILMQLDGKVIEKLTGQPYDPKREYPTEVVMQALKLVELEGGSVRYVSTLANMIREVKESGIKKVAIFNDIMREAIKKYAEMCGVSGIEFMKTCGGAEKCVEVNPPGAKSGWRVSLPGTAGRLTAEQMVEMFRSRQARVYYIEILAKEVPHLCI
jgi:hypothetical protein